MALLFFVISSFLQGAFAPAKSLDELAALLRKIESLPTKERGAVTAETRTFPGGKTKVDVRTVRFAIAGSSAMVAVTFLDENQQSQTLLSGRNDRLEFDLRRTPNGWSMTRYGRLGGAISNEINLFLSSYFPATYRIHKYRNGACLSDLISRQEYATRLTRQGPLEYRIAGHRLDRGDREGVLDFTAIVPRSAVAEIRLYLVKHRGVCRFGLSRPV